MAKNPPPLGYMHQETDNRVSSHTQAHARGGERNIYLSWRRKERKKEEEKGVCGHAAKYSATHHVSKKEEGGGRNGACRIGTLFILSLRSQSALNAGEKKREGGKRASLGNEKEAEEEKGENGPSLISPFLFPHLEV